MTCESGTTSIEFAILLPLFVLFLLVVTDATLLFLRQTTLMNVARDTARAVSRHAMTESEAQTYAQAAATTGQGAAAAKVTAANGIVTVLITADAQTAAPFGVVRFAVGDKLMGSAINVMEPK